MTTAIAPPKPRKPRGLSKLKPRHYDYLRLRQAGKSQKEAIQLTGLPQKTAYRAEKHPDGAKFLAEIAENARIAGQYGVKEAVQEVDKAISFAYEQENPNAIAKLLEHKSKLFGLLVEKIDVTTTYIDLKGALDQAKERVLKQLNPMNRGIVAIQTASAQMGQNSQIDNSSVQSDPTPSRSDSSDDASTSIDNIDDTPRLQENDTSTDTSTQA